MKFKKEDLQEAIGDPDTTVLDEIVGKSRCPMTADFIEHGGRTLEREPIRGSRTWRWTGGDDSAVETMELTQETSNGPSKPLRWYVTFSVKPSKGDTIVYMEAAFAETPAAALTSFDAALAALQNVFP